MDFLDYHDRFSGYFWLHLTVFSMDKTGSISGYDFFMSSPDFDSTLCHVEFEMYHFLVAYIGGAVPLTFLWLFCFTILGMTIPTRVRIPW